MSAVQPQTNRTMVMIAIMVATFLTAIEGTVVSTAMPKIVSDLQGLDLMNWVFSIYLLVSSVAVPIFGKLSDLFGRKRILVIGTLIFLAGSTLCGFAANMEQLIIYRFIQGIGSGAILPISTAIIADLYPFEKRAKMMGLVGFVWGAAGILGPLFGGFLVDYVTWHWIFFINIPFGIATIVLIVVYLKEKIEKTKKSIDYWGALTFSLGLLALLYAVQKGSETNEWLSPFVLLLFAAFVICMALFVIIESKVEEPMIPLTIFRSLPISMSNAITFIVHAIMIGLVVYVPMWVQGILGLGATQSGFILMPMSITWAIGAFWSGRIINRGFRMASIIGTSILLLSTLWFLTIQMASSTINFVLISTMIGFGFGITVTLYTLVAQSSVEPNMRGVATSANMLFRTLGQTIGISIFGSYFNITIANQLASSASSSVDPSLMNQLINPAKASELTADTQSVLRDALATGIHELFIILISLAALTLVLSVFLPGKDKETKPVNSNA
ncbi:MFS transporter [Paenibacillus sp. N1-5-1-14]|uniref:MDR family MFS transporter n=1 Tax=Paenibacillus radicibacter TaxID=2972488 RepID=UPI002158A8B7|nr:MDR family MFS transporter [Paenibacillus radicibacter]MCR8642691.1 MFS transporter [Paenibacillus radicibacter]